MARRTRSDQYIVDDLGRNGAGQLLIEPFEAVGQAVVVEAELVEDRGKSRTGSGRNLQQPPRYLRAVDGSLVAVQVQADPSTRRRGSRRLQGSP